MSARTIEISVKGRWVCVPAFDVKGLTIFASGRALKIAEIHQEYWCKDEVEDPASYVDPIKTSKLNADLFAFTQKLPNTTPRFSYPFRMKSIAAIRVSSFDDWWRRVSSDTRRNVKLSKSRGLVLRIEQFNEDLVRGIVGINNETPIRQGRKFWHYGKTYEEVKKDYSSFPDRSYYVAAYIDDELVAFLKAVVVGDVLAIMQNLSKMRYRDKKPANALIAKAVEIAAEKNLKYITYFQYQYGNKRNDPLTEFKRRNGFEELRLPRFFVPLTLKGRLALNFGLHRPLSEILPGGVSDSLLGLRSRWHSWRNGPTNSAAKE
jgi:hypothetical protein